MAIIDYLRSLLLSVGLSQEKLPLFFGILLVALAAFYARPFLSRVGRVIEAVFLHNWQLGLLGTTGVMLTLASGWTTWDGMRNFTGDAILSGMVTFGIQGLMLIVAWLIGESFATGMNHRIAPGKYVNDNGALTSTMRFASTIMLAGVTCALPAAVLFAANSSSHDLSQMAQWLAIAGGGIMLIGLLVVASSVPNLRGYFDAMRVMLRTAMLWVMFLACMTTSVFFSFDSLFSTIFPASERARAAQLRAQNQVSGIVADIAQTITHGLLAETETLFNTDGWKAYDGQLTKLAAIAQDSQKAIEEYFQKQMEDNRTAIATQQERIATANSGAVGLVTKKTNMTDELARLKADRPALAEDYAKRKSDMDALQKELDDKRVEAMAESRGVEGSGKVGEGPLYRQRKAEEQTIKDKQKIAEERLRDAQKRFQTVETRLTQLERELSLVDGDIAKMKGETQTAEQRIKLAEDAKDAGEGLKLDPTRIIPAFEKARAEFRQTPKIEGLAQVQSLCGQLVQSLLNPATKDKVAGIDCDPKSAAEAASRVFALNAGIVNFETNCAGGDKLAKYNTTDELFGFARKCVQDSGLASHDTDELRRKINFVELNRDDKANRFVVTWNAFQDGNRLAYLSLAIAIAVDGLVFMSGLFGANAVRSPLSDMPSVKARSADDLERIMDNALLPHRFETARTVIEAMHADTSLPGYSAHVDLRELDPQSEVVVRRVLTAGATIGAVLRNPNEPSVYAVRPELFEYLSITGARAFERHGKLVQEDIAEKVRLSDIEKQVRVALLPDEQENVDAVLRFAHPINVTADGFMCEILLDEVKQEPRFVLPVRGVLNVGAAHNLVQREKDTAGRYELHGDLYKALSRIRARMLMSTARAALQLSHDQRTVRDGGTLQATPHQVSGPNPRQSLLGTQAVLRDAANTDPDLKPASSIPLTPVAIDRARAKAKGQRPRADAEPPFVEPLAPVTDAEAAAFDQELCEHFAREMLTFHPEQIAYVRDQSPTIDVPALEIALVNVSRFDEQLRMALQQAKTGLEDSIEAARSSFDITTASNAPEDAETRLDTLADTLHRMTALMVLMPGQAYVNIVHAMQAGLTDDEHAARLTDAKSKQLDLLRQHIAELRQADRTPDHWGTILQSLNAFGRGMAALAANADQRQGGRG